MCEGQRDMGRQQQEEWARFRAEIMQPLYEKVAGGDEKNAKALADILKICQEGERKAHVFAAEGGEAEDSSLQVCFEGE